MAQTPNAEQILNLSAGELVKIPLGRLLTMCSEAGLTKDHIDVVVQLRSEHEALLREVGEIEEIVSQTMSNPVVQSAMEKARKAQEASQKAKRTRHLVIAGVCIAFVFVLASYA